MTTPRRFALVRHDIRADLPDVYRDPALLGTWLQLYLHADAVWPDVAECPRVVDPELYERLADARAVVRDREDGYFYRVPMLDRDRDAKVEEGRRAVQLRDDRKGRSPLPEPEYRHLLRAFYGPSTTNVRTYVRIPRARARLRARLARSEWMAARPRSRTSSALSRRS